MQYRNHKSENQVIIEITLIVLSLSVFSDLQEMIPLQLSIGDNTYFPFSNLDYCAHKEFKCTIIFSLDTYITSSLLLIPVTVVLKKRKKKEEKKKEQKLAHSTKIFVFSSGRPLNLDILINNSCIIRRYSKIINGQFLEEIFGNSFTRGYIFPGFIFSISQTSVAALAI